MAILHDILYFRPRLVMDNSLTFPYMEAETRRPYARQDAFGTEQLFGQDEPREVALVQLLLPIHIFLDALSAEIQTKGRSGLEDQPSLFRTVEDLVTSHTGAPGHACVLRFICELQHHPLERWSLLGQLISVLFTPEYGDKNQLLDYATSHRLGRRIRDSRDCASHYGECPLSVFRYMEAFGNSTVTT